MLQANTYLTPVKPTTKAVNNHLDVVVEDEIVASLELMKVLHKCQNKEGWTLLVAPDNVPNKSLLESTSIDVGKLLIIRKKHIYDLQYVLNSAIGNGNFAAVVLWTDIANTDMLAQMNLPQTEVSIHCFQSA
ncbi:MULTISPECIES: hypothetical protein [unclassified Pseudoalteromonas]|uniref:hypothetical protein n=1 Tax=unclassified Pseudoalteromonas TaxID=194690 RepID=UPI003014DD57